jgi:transcriptional regulator with XRE-family HTH domain
MDLRIKEIAKQKGITLGEIAKKLNISNVNLSNSLNGNPTLNRLKEVSDILEVELWQIFPKEQDISGIVRYNGQSYSIDTYKALYDLTDKVKAENP